MHPKLAVLLPFLLAVSSVAVVPVADETDAAHAHLEARATTTTSKATLALQRGSRSTTSTKPVTSTKVTSTKLSSTAHASSTTTSKASSSSPKSTTTTRAVSSSSKSTSVAAPTSTAPATSPGAGDPVPDAWSSGILSAHNAARSTHGAVNLVWSSELTSAAKSWAEACVWHHGGTSGVSGGAGQNLAAAGSSASTASQSGQAVVNAWMSEESAYDPSNPTYSHFTQVVWKSTQELGCFQASCAGEKFVNPDGTTVFPASIKSVVYTVCDYRKPGNYAGQYAANVSKNS